MCDKKYLDKYIIKKGLLITSLSLHQKNQRVF